MATLTDYFKSIGYKHVYDLGDRVEGKWNGIPFVGSVGNDRLVDEDRGPEITIHLDLPIKYEDKIHNFIIVKHKDVKWRKSS